MALLAAPVQLVMDYRTQKIADLPLFNGDKSDAISPEDFVRKTDTAKDAMRWDDATTAVHFKACLRGTALAWLKAQEFKSIDINNWTTLKPVFCDHFVTPFKEASTLTALSDLHMKPSEHPRDFDSRVCQVLIDIKKARPNFVANIPVNPAERTDAVLAAAFNAALDHDLMHVAKCLFISGLSADIREKVVEKKPISLQEANQCANELFESMSTNKSSTKLNKIEAVNGAQWSYGQNDRSHGQDEDIENDEEIQEAILAIQRKRQGYFQSNQNRGNNSNTNRSYQPQRSNQSTQKPSHGQQQKYCLYCKMDNHFQENCFVRKRKGHALVGKDGKPMRTPGTHEFNLWKNELAAKGKNVMIINDNLNESASNKSATLN